MAADAAHQPAQMATDFLARGCCAGRSIVTDAMTGGGIVDMDGQQAAFAVMAVKQRQLLMPMYDIEGIIDVERDDGARGGSWRSRCPPWRTSCGPPHAGSARSPSATPLVANTARRRFRAAVHRPA